MTESQASASFPRRWAATRRFTLGRPRAFAVAPDGSRVAFLRSRAGDDPTQRLWVSEPATGRERCVLDPDDLDVDETDLPAEEQARRERTREQAGGVVGFACDRAVRHAAVPLGGRVLLVDLVEGTVRDAGLDPPVVDPRLSPDGRRLAFVRDGDLHVVDLDAGTAAPVTVAASAEPDVTWGLAEFVAAEEMRRTRGFWWSPDGERLAAARVDVGPVARWHLADPVDPDAAPRPLRFPAAGQANAEVSLAIVGAGVEPVAVDWDRAGLPYLAAVTWSADAPLTIAVQSRDQGTVEIRTVDPDDGATALATRLERAPWVELIAGTPRWADGRLLTVRDDDRAGPGGTRRLYADDEPLTPDGLQVRSVLGASRSAALVSASGEDPTEVGVWRVGLDDGRAERLDPGGGVATAGGTPDALVLEHASLDAAPTAEVRAAGRRTVLRGLAERPPLTAAPELARLGERRLASALLRPSWHDGREPLPVLLDPYGGPHAQRVLRTEGAFLASQWFAETGFAVLVTDGRGSPGRGPAWEGEIAGDLASAPLADQVDALEAALERWPFLDPTRVAIRGWSFGGFLAALAVLRRPDVFHAAIAGAPVTDWRLYDTHYTERYLGDPATDPQAYDRSSLLDDAAGLARPLLLIHGLSDDNVVVAHTLRLSRALTEAGRPHRVLPLSGVTHMTPQEVVAERLLTLQRDFLAEALALG